MDGKPLVQVFADDLTALIEKYEDSGLTVAETIGAMELAKMDVIRKSAEDSE